MTDEINCYCSRTCITLTRFGGVEIAFSPICGGKASLRGWRARCTTPERRVARTMESYSAQVCLRYATPHSRRR